MPGRRGQQAQPVRLGRGERGRHRGCAGVVRRRPDAHLPHQSKPADPHGDLPHGDLSGHIRPPEHHFLHPGALPCAPHPVYRARHPEVPRARHEAAPGRRLWRQADRRDRGLSGHRDHEDRPAGQDHLHPRGVHDRVQPAPRDGGHRAHRRHAGRHHPRHRPVYAIQHRRVRRARPNDSRPVRP